MRLSVAALLACLFALGACGGSSDRERRLLTEREAQALLRHLDRAETAVASGDCDRAREHARAGEDRASDLANRVHRELRDNLVDWFEHLEARIAADCEEEEEEEEPEESPTPEETPDPTPEPTIEPTPDPTPEATPEPTPEATPEPPPTGGVEPPDENGVAPGG